MTRVWIGTSGYSYNHWAGVFYPLELPQKEWLPFYAQRFSTVEINNTFYQLPPSATFLGWKKKVDPGFRLAIKASRYLTHIRRLKEPGESLRKLLDRAHLLGNNLGPILFQLPPRWHLNLERLKGFLAALPTDFCHVMEYRDEDWFKPEVKQIMQEYNVGFCIHDFPGIYCPHWVTSDVVYIRRHGPGGKYQGKYSRNHLLALAGEIKDYIQNNKEVFVYFNNDQSGFAIQDALELKELLADA